MQLARMLPDGWFKVERNKGVKEVVRHHSDQPEGFNSPHSVFVNMVGMPIGSQFIKCLVFDIPSCMANGDK